MIALHFGEQQMIDGNEGSPKSMLPQFPSAKLIEIKDKPSVDKKLRGFLPYSDFNFINLWSWDIYSQTTISELYGNLVVKFTDYWAQESFYSFIGLRKTDATVRILLDTASREGLKPALRLVPHDVVERLDRTEFDIQIERDHADYVFSLDQLWGFAGKKFKKKREDPNWFRKTHPSTSLRRLNLGDDKIRKEIDELYHRWNIKKTGYDVRDGDPEYIAFRRFLDPVLCSYLIAFGLVIDDKLAAFQIIELLDQKYCIAHCCKADTEHRGIMPFLMRELSGELTEIGVQYMDAEEDLGIEGLRISKMGYRPHRFLLKYTITRR